MQIEEINKENIMSGEQIDTSSIEMIKEISKMVSKQDIKKIMEQIPQEAINQISDEDIKTIKEVKDVTPETLEELSAGLEVNTKKILKYLGAGAVLATVGVGSYCLGNLNSKKANAQCEDLRNKMEELEVDLKNSYETGYKKGYKKGNKIGSVNGYNTALQKFRMNKIGKQEAISMPIVFLAGAATASKVLNSQNQEPLFLTENSI